MAVKPVLGDWEIPRVAMMRTAEARKFAELPVPGRQGSLFQDLNAEPTLVEIAGSLFADEERSEFLTTVREKFRAGEPVTFVADITEATDIQFVVIDSMRFEQRADRPDEVSYHLTLRESPPPPPPPDPLGGIDTSLLDEAAGFVEGVTDERPHHPIGDLAIGLALEGSDLGLGELRPLGRQVEAAVAGETRQHDVLEAERLWAPLRALARADIAH